MRGYEEYANEQPGWNSKSPGINSLPSADLAQ